MSQRQDIRWWRSKQNEGLAQLGAVIGVNPGNLSRMERGLRVVPVDVLMSIITHYGLSTQESLELLRWAAEQARSLRITRAEERAA